MDINYYKKIQNVYGTKNKREKELVKVNHEMSKHFEDTFGTDDVLLNGTLTKLMIIKDTDGNTYKKKIKSKKEDRFNIGDYVQWNNQIWLITLVDSDERTWNRGYMYLCTLPLRWQNSKGEIIERWAYAEDFTKYSSGVTGNMTIKIGDNQYGLILPIDEETKKLKRDMRFSIDFDDSEFPDVYKLTNKKSNLTNDIYFGRGGTITLTMSFDSFNKDTDKKVVLETGQEVWICNYNNFSSTILPIVHIPDESTYLSAIISGNKNLRNGYNRIYTVNFKDTNNNVVDWNDVNFQWNIVADFEVVQKKYDNKIELSVDNEDLVDVKSSFLLQILINNLVISEIKINISE